MKKLQFLSVLALVITLAFGLVFAACDNGGGGGGSKEINREVDPSLTPKQPGNGTPGQYTPPSTGAITFKVEREDGTRGGDPDNVATTALVITFSAKVESLNISEVKVTNDTGKAVAVSVYPSNAPTYTKYVVVLEEGKTEQGFVNVSITRSGISTGAQSVGVYSPTASASRSFTVTTDESSYHVENTTKLIITIDTPAAGYEVKEEDWIIESVGLS